MATSAKGNFPGKPRKKIQKQVVKFRQKFRKHDLLALRQMCTHINDVSKEFQDLFQDDNEDTEFIGFSSEECGLCAYKKVAKILPSPTKASNDILRSDKSNSSKDKVVTRNSFALENAPDSNTSDDSQCSSSLTVRLVSIDMSLAKESLSLSGNSQHMVDGAFTKYKDSKLDFHRLSKKAKNKESYEDCTEEEQAKRKDTSTASLKYASEIYLAKGGATVLGGSKSPIKPATFIPPLSRNISTVDLEGNQSTSFKGSQKIFETKKRGVGHANVMTKALLNRANRSLKKLGENNSSLASKSSKSPHGFNLPTKSVRSSRIIKANRKYMDSPMTTKTKRKDVSSSLPQSTCDPTGVEETSGQNAESETRKEEKESIMKPNNFERIDENTPVVKVVDMKAKSRLKKGPDKLQCQSRSRSFIKRARFKHPTSSDALVLGTDYSENNSGSPNKNPIRQATFTPPPPKIQSRSPKKSSKTDQSQSEPGDLGLSSSVWARVAEPNGKKWVVGDVSENIPPWTRQEIHNILHGAHTFGRAWSRIARHYDFHPYHKDWLSAYNKAKKCGLVGLLNENHKVKSSILLQLKPKLSQNPNITVFTPAELQTRGLPTNIPCTYAKSRRRCSLYNSDVWANNNSNPKEELSHEKRIFGTRISEVYQLKKVKLRKIAKEDLNLGLSTQSMLKMIKPRILRKKPCAPWEIHNILHGVHYFGIGSWATICSMYRFLEGHDNLYVRARFRSICCRGLIVAGDVRPDILPRLHVVLSKKGKKYFRNRKISVTICSLSKKNVLSPEKRNEKFERKQNSSAPKSDTKNEVTDSDDLSISPARSAIHLFGAVPLWDDTSKPEIIDPDDEADPVIHALESSLRENLSPQKSRRRASCDDVITSPSSYDLPTPTEVTKEGPSAKESKRRSRCKSETISSPITHKVKGPRIKHVCRRASLVTGHSLATTGDEIPHLTALPQEEREKIFANSEKLKEADISSDENSAFKTSNKIVATPTKKKTRKRPAAAVRRCGNCASCKEEPCLQCELCRKSMDNEPSSKVVPCKQRKPCLQHCTNDGNIPAKKTRKPPASLPLASRKSSRLQQQLVPLVAPLISETSNGHLSTVEAPPYLDATTLPYDALSSPDSFIDLSPATGGNFFDRLNAQRQALIKIENWKGTYDYNLLWKTGGQPLITSTPAPPKQVCLLCGSRGHPEEEVDRLINCSSCCEVFHTYCADVNHLHPVTKKAMESDSWMCKKCKGCSVCGMTGKMVECKRCLRSFHGDCLGPTYPTKLTDEVWICMQCVYCKSCGATKPGHMSGSKWTHNYTMCQRCGDLYDKGNYCSICQKCYNDDDYNCRMIQCAKCKRWIHSTCESLTVEMYTILSHMPDSVQYKCPACDGRSCKLKNELGYSEGRNEKVNIDKVRTSLAKLPPPLWKKLIEHEMQGGLESIIMSLFHNQAAFSVLKKNESASDGSDKNTDAARPRDLFAIRFAVHNHRYHSIGQFNADVTNVIRSVCDEAERETLEKSFRETAGSTFSWFNFETGKIKDTDNDTEDILLSALCPPHADHNYAVGSEKEAAAGSPVVLSIEDQSFSSEQDKDEYRDLRQCLFCSHYGDGLAKECGRLLFCGQDEWAHVNCALWSAEVFEQHDGSLKNVHSAASRGKMMKCDYCRLPGATVGCNTRDCPKNYHFRCAQITGCVFQHDKKLFCRRHSSAAKTNLVLDDDFEVERLVCVDNDETRPNRCWQRGVPADSITITIGSLTVRQLGRLSVASDSKNYLKPISYRITRVFWSTFHAGKKTVYTVTISENKSVNDKADSTTHDNANHTIAHLPQEEPLKSPPKLPERIPSPPPVRRTDLAERMNTDSHIGPLSPTRRIGNHPERSTRKGGTYTIISSINRTLPQMVTPLPEKLSYSTASTNSQAISSVKISTKNPFLNCLSASDPPVSDTVGPSPVSQTFVPSKSSVVGPTSASSTSFSKFVSESCEVAPLLTQLLDKPTPLRTGAKLTPLFSTPLAPVISKQSLVNKNQLTKSDKTSPEKQDTVTSVPNDLKTGTSGLVLSNSSKVDELDKTSTGKLSTCKPTSAIGVVSSDAIVTAEVDTNGKNSTPNANVSCSPVLKANLPLSGISSVDVFQSTASNKLNSVKTPSASISLIQGARDAVNTENQARAQILQPQCWLKKSKASSSKKRTSQAKNAPFKNKRPSYTLPALKSAYLKRKRSNYQAPSSNNFRGPRHRKCSNVDYNESNFDKILEEAISLSDDVDGKAKVVLTDKNSGENLTCLDDVTGDVIEVNHGKKILDEAMPDPNENTNPKDSNKAEVAPKLLPVIKARDLIARPRSSTSTPVTRDSPVSGVRTSPKSDLETSDSLLANISLKMDKNSPSTDTSLDPNSGFDEFENKTLPPSDLISLSSRDSVIGDHFPDDPERKFLSPKNSEKSADQEKNIHSSGFVEYCSEISDEDEVVFPSTQLRKFALRPNSVSPIHSTRSRSRSYEPQSHSKGSNINPRGRSLTLRKKSRRVSDDGSAAALTINPPNLEADSSRRYPRRNTYTCLKSFSGLSPNYALASYSRLDRNARRVGKAKKVLKISNSRQPNTTSMPTSLVENSPINISSVTTAVSLNSTNDSCPISCASISAVAKFTACSVTTASGLTSTNYSYPIASTPTVVAKSTLTLDTLAAEKCVDNVETTSSISSELGDDAQSVMEADIDVKKCVMAMLEEVLNNLENATSHIKDSPQKSPLEESRSILLDLDDSIELFRGGNEDENPLLDRTLTPLQASLADEVPVSSTSPTYHSGPQNIGPKVSIPPKNVSTDLNPKSGAVGANSHDLESVSSPLSTSESIPFLPNGECPVLSADDVKTVLDSSTNPQTEYQIHSKISIPLNQLTVTATPAPYSSSHRPAMSGIVVHQNPKQFSTNVGPVVPMGKTIPRPQIYTSVPVIPTLTPMIVNPQIMSARQFPLSLGRNSVVAPRASPAPTAGPASLRPTVAVNHTQVVPPAFKHAITQGPASNTSDMSYIRQMPFAKPISSSTKTDSGMVSTSALFTNQFDFVSTQQISAKARIVPRAQAVHNPQPSLGINAVTSVSNSPVPVFQPANAAPGISSLEHLIDFYSAKNKLSAEEKAIVRSIITNQINKSQTSSNASPTVPANDPKKLKPTSNSILGKSKNLTATNKRRSSSRDKVSEPKSKKKRKEKIIPKQDNDENINPLLAVTEPEKPSCLLALYQKRQFYAKKYKKPINQVLSNFNIFIGNIAKWDSEKRSPTSPNQEGAGIEPQLIYEIKSDDGYHAKGTDLEDLIDELYKSINDCWMSSRSTLPFLSLHSIMKAHAFLGLSHDAVRFLVEQLPGARHCPRYKAKYHKHNKTKEEISHINPHGCCRAEEYKGRSKPDMFSFLASKHRPPPEYQPDKSQSDDMIQLSNRRATSMESLPMAMRFRHLRTFSKQAVGVYRSSIHGRGLYCKRDIEDGEMIMEYTGQIIRQELTDKREQHYESKGIGCYMFRMDDTYVVDATVMGSAARFINHSCEPNCYSRIVHVEGKKHIVIFALRKIYRGEEFTYDYKFPIEDASHKIACNCGSRLCRKFMN